MLKYKSLILIGTSHISMQSIKEVEQVILDKKPDIVAIELDKSRLQGLFSQERKLSIKDIRKIGVKGFIFSLIGHYVEKKLGEIVNVKPGSEMIKAIETAKKTNSRVALIDQDIRITLKKISDRLTYKEKLGFISDLFKGIFIKQKIEFDLSKVPDKKIIDNLTKELKKRYPTLYEVLISERNLILAKNLHRLLKTERTIVGIVGAGHEKEIINIIKDLDKNV